MVFSAITWDFNPEIFSIGNHGVRWYGLMIALALFTGYLIFKRYLRGDKLTVEMLDKLLALAKIPMKVELDKDRLRPSDLPYQCGDYSLLERDSGWKPAISIDETLSDLLDYWRLRLRKDTS